MNAYHIYFNIFQQLRKATPNKTQWEHYYDCKVKAFVSK